MSLNPEQMARRSKGVGASDAAAAVGLNPYVTSVELWMEKRGELPPFEGNEPTKWGKLLEAVVRQEAAEQTGRVIRLPPETIEHPVHKFMLCHPDGVTDDGRLYEGKTARFADNWGEPGTDQVPEHYLIQCQHAMFVTGLLVCDLAVLIGGQDFRLYELQANEGIQTALVAAEAEFWQHVEKGTRPELNYKSPGAIEVLKKLYPGTNGQTLTAQAPELLEWRQALETASADGKAAKARAEEAKAALLDYMGEASVLRFPDGRSLRRARIDRKGYVVEPTSYIDARWINSR
jgi:putative phage-type endonuclease